MRTMMMLVIIVLWASCASSQHPCDLPAVTGDIHDEGWVPMGWCHPADPATPVIWRLSMNDAAPLVLTYVVTSGEVSASGERFYMALVRFTRGGHILTLTAGNDAGESEPTAPFKLRCARVRK